MSARANLQQRRRRRLLAKRRELLSSTFDNWFLRNVLKAVTFEIKMSRLYDDTFTEAGA